MTDQKRNHQPGFGTRCVHTGVLKDDTFNACSTPIYATSTFSFSAPGEHKGYDYSRTGNPTRTALQENLAALEGGAGAVALNSGMAAVACALHLLPPDAHVIACHDIYGGTHRLMCDVLTKRGVTFEFVDMREPANVTRAWRDNTRMVWIETPGNPLMNLVDLQAVCAIAADKGAVSVVDNTFMTPYFQRPFEHGADIVVHSTTKYLNGHADIIGGAVIARTEAHAEELGEMANNLGVNCSPFDAFLVLRGIKTLPLRMRRHEANAAALAELLDAHPKVERVYYPGLNSHPQHELAARQTDGHGGMLSFDIQGGAEAAFAFIQRLQYFHFAESLGGVAGLIEHPATMSHASMTPAARDAVGIHDGTIRVSTGIEDTADILADFKQALDS